MAKRKAVSQESEAAGRRQSREASTGLTPRTETGLERIIFFSDAVMAIAITLLAIEIRLPEEVVASSELTTTLLALVPQYASFIISFFVIGMFWVSHHRLFEYIRTYDRGLIWINMLFLFLVAFVPFPSTVLGRFPAEVPSVVFYASVMVGLSLVRIWLWWYVYYRAHLTRPETNPRAGRQEFFRAVWTACVFGISILIAFWNAGWAMNFWFLLIPLTVIPGSHS